MKLLKTYNALVKDHDELHKSYDSNNSLLTEQVKEFQEVEEYIVQLQRIIGEGEQRIELGELKFTALTAEYKAQEVYVERLKIDIDLLKQRGVTLSKQKEMEDKDTTIKCLEDDQIKVEKQLKVALKRVQDLQDELQLYKAGLI